MVIFDDQIEIFIWNVCKHAQESTSMFDDQKNVREHVLGTDEHAWWAQKISQTCSRVKRVCSMAPKCLLVERACSMTPKCLQTCSIASWACSTNLRTCSRTLFGFIEHAHLILEHARDHSLSMIMLAEHLSMFDNIFKKTALPSFDPSNPNNFARPFSPLLSIPPPLLSIPP